jgi:hypothetical protein
MIPFTDTSHVMHAMGASWQPVSTVSAAVPAVRAGEDASCQMHLGAYGQAYFAAETMEIVSGEQLSSSSSASSSSKHCTSSHNLCCPVAAAFVHVLQDR